MKDLDTNDMYGSTISENLSKKWAFDKKIENDFCKIHKESNYRCICKVDLESLKNLQSCTVVTYSKFTIETLEQGAKYAQS